MEGRIYARDFAQLAKSCAEELSKYQHKESTDGYNCLELLRSAVVGQVEQCWLLMQQLFTESVRIWLRRHPSYRLALLSDSEENYIAQTFSRFWLAVHEGRLEFHTLPALLGYLRATLNSVLIDTGRMYMRARYVSLTDLDLAETLSPPDSTIGRPTSLLGLSPPR